MTHKFESHWEFTSLTSRNIFKSYLVVTYCQIWKLKITMTKIINSEEWMTAIRAQRVFLGNVHTTLYFLTSSSLCWSRKFPAKKASLTQITSQVIDRIKRFGKFKCCYWWLSLSLCLKLNLGKEFIPISMINYRILNKWSISNYCHTFHYRRHHFTCFWK